MCELPARARVLVCMNWYCRMPLPIAFPFCSRWTREEGVQYMHNNTYLPTVDLENEIDHVITWPGHACAYRIGEIKIKEYREKARRAFGKLT